MQSMKPAMVTQSAAATPVASVEVPASADVCSWSRKNAGNIRALLCSLHTVLWEDSGWQVVGIADLLDKTQIRKVWMRANLLVHPDKVRQSEQAAVAAVIFDALKDAWHTFQACDA
jgi:hypothetical protein